jgi:hypothetical protein
VKSGVEWEFDRLVRGTFSAGYSYQTYDASSRNDFGSVVWDARIDWLTTQDLNLFARAGQLLEETSLVGADGRLATKLGGGIVYEVLRNAVVSAELDLEHSDFLGTAREELTWTARLGALYLMNKNLKFTFAYEYLERDSSFDQFDGDNNRVKVGVSWSF